jgi:hypothetical protein
MAEIEADLAEARRRNAEELAGVLPRLPGWENFLSDEHVEIAGAVIETSGLPLMVEQLLVVEKYWDSIRRQSVICNEWKEVVALLEFDKAPAVLTGELDRDHAYYFGGKPQFIFPVKVGDSGRLQEGIAFKAFGAEGLTSAFYFPVSRCAVAEVISLTKKFRQLQMDPHESRLLAIERQLSGRAG